MENVDLNLQLCNLNLKPGYNQRRTFCGYVYARTLVSLLKAVIIKKLVIIVRTMIIVILK